MASQTKNHKKRAPSGAKKTSSGAKTTRSAAAKPQSDLARFKKEIWGVACAVLALMVILSSLDKSSFLARLFMGLVGDGGLYVLPIGLILCAIALLFHGDRPVLMRVLCSLGFAFLVSGIIHLAKDSSTAKWGFDMFPTLFEEGKKGLSGGVIGGLIAMLLSLPGGRITGWALCILLLLVTLPASLNLTLTGLLRAVNNHRDELRRQDREAEYREPAEVLVERVVQRRQDREERRQDREERRRNRDRFDYDLPVDDPDAKRREERPAKVRPASASAAADRPAEEADRAARKTRRNADIDLPVDDPVRPAEAPAKRAEEPAAPQLSQEPPVTSMPVDSVPVSSTVPMNLDLPEIDGLTASPGKPALPEIKTPPSEKVKPSEARRAAAEVGWQVENAAEAAPKAYVYPPTDLLNNIASDPVDASAEMRENTRRLQEKLACFNVDAQIVNVTRGPNVTMYELQLPQGVRLSKVTGLADDIALELGASGVRISAIQDKNSMVGIEVPNKQVSTVTIREVIESREFQNARSKISFAVGKDINGNCIVGDISKMPHVLIAGTTGSGKSVCTNSILVSLLYKATPEEVKLIVIDPKMVEFGIYNGIPHLLIPVVTDAKKAAGALQWAVTEMMRRYRTLSETGVRDIESYNKLAATDEEIDPMPKLVVVIDELADLMMAAGKEVEEAICRIAQMGRASGVHLVIATQRPSADVITGLMKANIPSRIALVVSSAMESRIILDAMGAEKLIGRGDMLYAPLGKGKKRVQGCFIDESEVQRVIDFVKSNGSADYNEDVQQEIEQRASQSGKSAPSATATPSNPEGSLDEEDGDELLPAAVDIFMETGMASVSMLQRRLKLGYARAARIVDKMEEKGIVGGFEGSKPRQLLITKDQWEAMKASGTLNAAAPVPAPVEDLIN